MYMQSLSTETIIIFYFLIVCCIELDYCTVMLYHFGACLQYCLLFFVNTYCIVYCCIIITITLVVIYILVELDFLPYAMFLIKIILFLFLFCVCLFAFRVRYILSSPSLSLLFIVR